MRYVAKNADFAPFPSRPQFHRLALTTVSRRACVSCASIKPVLPQHPLCLESRQHHLPVIFDYFAGPPAYESDVHLPHKSADAGQKRMCLRRYSLEIVRKEFQNLLEPLCLAKELRRIAIPSMPAPPKILLMSEKSMAKVHLSSRSRGMFFRSHPPVVSTKS